MTTKLTRQKAEAHEALYPALAKLSAQLDATAVRKPAAPVPAAARAIAADLLFEAQRFTGVRRGLPEVAADIGGLSAQLGRALAGLEAFELAHASWNAELKIFAWHVQGDRMPVKRLRQTPPPAEPTAREHRLNAQQKRELYRMLDGKMEDNYDRGYADASSGHERRFAAR